MSLKNRAGSCGCCGGCNESTLTWNAVKPNAATPITGNATAIGWRKSEHAWEVWSPGDRVGNTGTSEPTFSHRMQFRFAVDGLLNDDIVSVTLKFRFASFLVGSVERNFFFKGFVSNPVTPADGLDFESDLSAAPSRLITNAELAGANFTTKTIDITTEALAAMSGTTDEDFLFGFFENQASSGSFVDTVKIEIDYGSGPVEFTPTVVNYRKQNTFVALSSSSDYRVGRLDTASYYAAVRVEFPSPPSRDILDATVFRILGPQSSDFVPADRRFVVRGFRFDSDLPTTLDDLLTWSAAAEDELTTANVATIDFDVVSFFSLITETPSSVVVFLGPIPSGNAGNGFQLPTYSITAPLVPEVTITDGVIYHVADGYWELTTPFPKDYWTAAITKCGVTGDKNPYRQQYLYEIVNASDDAVLFTVQMTIQERLPGDFEPPEWINGREDHAEIVVTLGATTYTAITTLTEAGSAFRITSRPGGVLMVLGTLTDAFEYDGAWSAATPNQYVDETTTHGLYVRGIGNSGQVKLRLKSYAVEPLDVDTPMVTSGTWSVARSRIGNDETGSRLECINPKVCTLKEPEFMTPRWTIDAYFDDIAGTSKAYEFCKSTENQDEIPAVNFDYSVFKSNAQDSVAFATAYNSDGSTFSLFGIDYDWTIEYSVPTITQPVPQSVSASCAIIGESSDYYGEYYLVEARATVQFFTKTEPPQAPLDDSINPVNLFYIALTDQFYDYDPLVGLPGTPIDLPINRPIYRAVDGGVDDDFLQQILPPGTQIPIPEGAALELSPLIGEPFYQVFTWPAPASQTVEVVWRRLVPKWVGAPPELTFTGTDPDVYSATPGTFNAITSFTNTPQVFTKTVDVYQERIDTDFSLVVIGAYTFQTLNVYRVESASTSISASSITITASPVSDSMPHPPEPAP